MKRFRRVEKIIGVLDHPVDGQAVEPALHVRGWVIRNDNKPVTIEITIDERVVQANVHRTNRDDVLKIHEQYAKFNETPGYLAQISTHTITPGRHSLSVYAKSGRERKLLGQVSIFIPDEEQGERDSDPLYWRAARLIEPENRLLLMHIPKTAGTSLTAYLGAQYEQDRTLLHAENRILGHTKAEVGSLEAFALISAHLKMDTLRIYLDSSRYFSTTVLREPIQQLISHFAWVKRLTDSKYHAELVRSPDYIQRSVERIERLDLVEYIDTLNVQERNLFDNCQFRYFLSRKATEVDEHQVAEALETMGGFDLIGTTERLYDYLLVLAFSMGWEPPERAPRMNTGKKEHFISYDSADEALKERFERLTRLDSLVYQHAQTLFETRLRAVVKALAQMNPNLRDSDLTPASLMEQIKVFVSAQSPRP